MAISLVIKKLNGISDLYTSQLQLLEALPLPRLGEYAWRGVCRPFGLQYGSPKPSGLFPSLGFPTQRVPSPRIPRAG